MENEYARFGLPDDPTNRPPPGQPTPSRQRGWLARNWGWLLPVGLLAVAMPCGCCGGILWWAIGILKSSEPYQTALQRVRSDHRVIEQLGEPIEERSWMPVGSFSYNNNSGLGSGRARFDFMVGGPKGTAHVHVYSVCRDGKWLFRVLDVTPAASGKTIVLSTEKKSGKSEEEDEPGEPE